MEILDWFLKFIIPFMPATLIFLIGFYLGHLNGKYPWATSLKAKLVSAFTSKTKVDLEAAKIEIAAMKVRLDQLQRAAPPSVGSGG